MGSVDNIFKSNHGITYGCPTGYAVSQKLMSITNISVKTLVTNILVTYFLFTNVWVTYVMVTYSHATNVLVIKSPCQLVKNIEKSQICYSPTYRSHILVIHILVINVLAKNFRVTNVRYARLPVDNPLGLQGMARGCKCVTSLIPG